ncbi:protein jag [Barrientosiimonas marina]|uniref:RNA-binding protein KhpB n=1 Tax=Lentibacillus kimchii TaxID=1542911 RepID=A0ABW2URI5_9BACI
MKEITASGQTIAEAVQSALEQLNTTRDHVNIEVIDEGKKGWLGVFGSKRAVVRVTMEENHIKTAEIYLQSITDKMNVAVDVTTAVSGKHVTFDLSGDKIALLIGKRGQTLNAIQYLVDQVVNKNSGTSYNVTVDAEGYRGRRHDALVGLAKKTADQVKRQHSQVALDAMPSFERKIIHNALQSDPHISTTSDGAEPYRCVVINPA